MIGITSWQSGEFDRAAAEMRAAIALRSDYGEAYFMLGTVLKQKGEAAPAEEALRTAIRLDPANPGPYNTLALLLRQKGDIEGSKRLFAEGARAKQAKENELGVMLGRQ
jgi:Flp pilus assembly protein TadD